MKAILFLLFSAAAFWFGWQTYPSIQKAAEKGRDALAAEQEKLRKQTRGELIAESRRDPATGRTRAESLFPETPKPAAPSAASITIPSPGAPAAPGTVAAANTPGAAVTPANPGPAAAMDEMEKRYPMPQFKTIEDITKEWTSIPYKAFPRKVKTKVPVMFDVTAGKVELPAGSEARAVAMTQGMLVLMKEGDDTARSMVPLANTDLKETLVSLYEKFKEYKRNVVIKQREHARAVKANANGASEDQMKLAGPKPKQDGGGVIGIMFDSIRSGKYTELKENTITSWGEINFEMVDGKPYWTATLQCMVENAIFGPQPTEVMALIRDNRVEKWIYTGSREEVQ
jgi:hypothetical protein